MSKRTVETCLTIGTPRGRLRSVNGVWDWEHLRWRVCYSIYAPSRLIYLLFDHGKHVEQEIHLARTFPNYGGVRWWFVCPKCSQRVALLHRPSYTHYFFCRHCYDLTYSSVKFSHTRAYAHRKNKARELGVTTR